MRLLILPAIVLLAACQPSATDDESAALTTNEPAPEAPPTPVAPAAPVPIPGPADAPPAAPAPTPPAAPVDPVPPTPDQDKSAAAATRVLERYFAAVATKDYRAAYRMWGGNGEATGMTFRQFADSFAKYRIYDGNVGKPGAIEGAAGSAYIEFPAKVTGVLARGGGFVLEGPMTLRRVNDVDGSTAEQRRWHIASSGLKPRP